VEFRQGSLKIRVSIEHADLPVFLMY